MMRPGGWAWLASIVLVGCGGTTPPSHTAGGASPRAGAAPAEERAAAGDVQGSEGRACSESGVAVQVLGSGGPIADSGRASSGYVVRRDGRAVLLVDAGGGVFARMGETVLRADDLQAVVITHFHVDHSADLSALLKSAWFGERSAALPLVGPTGNDRFPGAEAFVDGLLEEDDGIYRYLSGYLEDEGDPFSLEVTEAEADGAPQTVFQDGRLKVEAMGVPHGPVPALAFMVTVGDTRVAFMGDQRADEADFVDWIEGADLLVAHAAIPESAGAAARRLHALPSRIGQVAERAGVGRVVLSHLMPRSLEASPPVEDIVADAYRGPVEVARDLGCYAAD